MKVKILLFGQKEVSRKVQSLISDNDFDFVASISDENAILDEISRNSPDVVLVTSDTAVDVRVCHQVYLLRPRSTPIIIADTDSIVNVREILKAGIHYIIPKSMQPADIISEVKNIYLSESNRQIAYENSSIASNKAKVVSIFGATDGIGKTTIAVNMGVALQRAGNKVCIVDFNLQFGDVGVFLGMNPEKSIVDLLQEQSNPGADLIRQYMKMHDSGLMYLSAPMAPEESNMVSVDQAERIINVIRVYYDYVIVDLGAGFNDINVMCFDISSKILLITGTDMAGIRNSKKALTVLTALADTEKIHLIINRNLESATKDSDIARALEIPIFGQIPYDSRYAVTAVNIGNPVISEFPKSKIGGAIVKVAQYLDEEDSIDTKG